MNLYVLEDGAAGVTLDVYRSQLR